MAKAAHVHVIDKNLIRIIEYFDKDRETFDTIDWNFFAILWSTESFLSSIQIIIVCTISVVVAALSKWINDDSMLRTPLTYSK